MDTSDHQVPAITSSLHPPQDVLSALAAIHQHPLDHLLQEAVVLSFPLQAAMCYLKLKGTHLKCHGNLSKPRYPAHLWHLGIRELDHLCHLRSQEEGMVNDLRRRATSYSDLHGMAIKYSPVGRRKELLKGCINLNHCNLRLVWLVSVMDYLLD